MHNYRNDLTEVADLIHKVSGVEVTNLSTNKQSLPPPKSLDRICTEAKTAVRGGYVCKGWGRIKYDTIAKSLLCFDRYLFNS